jgi:uncharacterized protein YjiS (DUF1127 family)
MNCPDHYLSLPTPRGGVEFRGLLTRLLDVRTAWVERIRQHRVLAALDDRLLADIGLDRAAVSKAEARLLWIL